MAVRWSHAENDEVWVYEHDDDGPDCAECGADLTDELWDSDGDNTFCIFCYENLFG